MNPVIVIPTFVSPRRRKDSGSVIATYDHTTPLSNPGELPRLLTSLQKVRGIGQIIVLVAAEPAISDQAAEKVQDIVSRFPSLNIAIIGADECNLVQQRMEQLGLGKLSKEIGLVGYGAIRNLGLVLGVGGAVMSPLGVWLASVSPGWLVICVAAIVIGFSAFKMFKKAVKCAPAPRAGAASAHSASPKPVPDQPHLSRKQYLQGACIGLIAGLASGYVGVGGGFIMVPLMLAVLDIPMSLASGTSLIAIMIWASPGVIEQGLLGNIEYLAGIAIVVGSIPGALVGARLVRVVPERQLRFIFGGFLLVAAVMLMLNEFGILG